MKVTCFYLVDPELSSSKYRAVDSERINEINGTFVYFYAFTPSRKVYNEFKKHRNMKLFVIKDIFMTREDYEVFCDENSDLLLEYHSFLTEGISDDKRRYEKTQVIILCTSKESSIILYHGNELFYDFIEYDTDILYIYSSVIELFNDDIQHVLLDYFYFSNFASYLFPGEECIDAYDYDIDGALMFWRLFGNTFKCYKKGGYNSNEIMEIFQKGS